MEGADVAKLCLTQSKNCFEVTGREMELEGFLEDTFDESNSMLLSTGTTK